MNTRKQLLATGRLVVPTVGLSLICGGVFLRSVPAEHMQTLRDVFSFLLLILGFILLATGMMWAVSHGLKTVFFKPFTTSPRDPDIHICTVDRPNFYPPSYGESQDSTNVVRGTATTPRVTTRIDVAPPVYTKSSSENFSEGWSLEPPPSYQHTVLQSRAGPHASDTNSLSE